MSKHNYSQYSKKKSDNTNGAGTVANASDNRKVGVGTNVPSAQPQPKKPAPAPEVKMEPRVSVTPMVETVDTVALPNIVEGVVVNCAKLNVREEPSTDSDIVCVLDVMSEIEIDVTKSTNEWFKVCTAIGAEGYCMRKFVDARL